MKILFLTNIPSPYMVNFFNEFGKLVDLTVLFEKDRADDRHVSWENNSYNSFKAIFLKGIRTDVDKALSFCVIKYIKKNKYDAIFVSNPATPTGIVAIMYMWVRKIPFIIESEGGFPKNKKNFKEYLKKFIISKASLYFSTTRTGDEYFMKYGAKKELIVHYPFTSIYSRQIIQNINEIQKESLKLQYGFSNLPLILSVGSFISLKRIEDLIVAFSRIKTKAQLLIIGEGELKKNYEKLVVELKIDNVKIIDFIISKELEKYYFMSDLFVFPTSSDCWGLVINEAMAKGLPIISTKMSIAAEALVENDENGYICDVGDISCFVNKIDRILSDKTKAYMMGKISLDKIKHYTFETMAQSHYQNIQNYNRYLKKLKK